MKHRSLRQLLLVAAAVVTPLATAADQSAGLAGAHELPAFVRDRIELTPGTFDEGEPRQTGGLSDATQRTARGNEDVTAR